MTKPVCNKTMFLKVKQPCPPTFLLPSISYIYLVVSLVTTAFSRPGGYEVYILESNMSPNGRKPLQDKVYIKTETYN